MKNISSIKEILYQQLQLLAEESKNIQPNDKGYKPLLVEYSKAICQVAYTYTHLLDIDKVCKELNAQAEKAGKAALIDC